MLKQRILTAIILAPLALYGVFGLELNAFMYLFDVVLLLAAWEWAKLSGFQRYQARMLYVAFVGACSLTLHILFVELPVQAFLMVAALFWLVALYWVVKYPKNGTWSGRLSRLCIGLVVLLPCWIAFVELKSTDNGEELILLLFLIVWGADIGAYFSGKKFGLNKLAPNVSPGKTREGLYGGLAACIIIALLFAFHLEISLNQLPIFVGLVIVTGLVSVLGDLFESMLKRHRGIKDSSRLLPGHGGILDRIDSLTAASPVFVLGLQYLVLA